MAMSIAAHPLTRKRLGASMTVGGLSAAVLTLGGFELANETLIEWAGGRTAARWGALFLFIGLTGLGLLVTLPGPVGAWRWVRDRFTTSPVRVGGVVSGLLLVAYAIARPSEDSLFRTAALLSGGLLFITSAAPGLRERLGIKVIKAPGGFEFVFLDAADRRELLATSSEPFDEEVGVATLAIDEAIAALLTDLPDELDGCSAKLFFYDPADNLLKAAFDSESEDGGDKAWAVGTGTTGTAWSSLKYEWAVGESVWNADFNVPPDRRERCRRFTAVASLPLFNATRTRPIAVLSISTEADDAIFGDVTSPAYLAHVRLAEIIEYLLNLSTDRGDD